MPELPQPAKPLAKKVPAGRRGRAGRSWKELSMIRCRECDHEFERSEKTCPECDAPGKAWPLSKFTGFYFVAGFVFIALYGIFVNPALLTYLATVWLLVGFALALVAYGRFRRNDSAGANLIYLLGIAWLVVLLTAGIFRIVDQGEIGDLTALKNLFSD